MHMTVANLIQGSDGLIVYIPYIQAADPSGKGRSLSGLAPFDLEIRAMF